MWWACFAAAPTTPVTRRTPADNDPSPSKAKSSTSPVRSTWVPPQGSTERFDQSLAGSAKSSAMAGPIETTGLDLGNAHKRLAVLGWIWQLQARAGGYRKILTDGLSHQRLTCCRSSKEPPKWRNRIEDDLVPPRARWSDSSPTTVRNPRLSRWVAVVGFDARTTFNIQTCAQRLPSTQRSGLHHPHEARSRHGVWC